MGDFVWPCVDDGVWVNVFVILVVGVVVIVGLRFADTPGAVTVEDCVADTSGVKVADNDADPVIVAELVALACEVEGEVLTVGVADTRIIRVADNDAVRVVVIELVADAKTASDVDCVLLGIGEVDADSSTAGRVTEADTDTATTETDGEGDGDVNVFDGVTEVVRLAEAVSVAVLVAEQEPVPDSDRLCVLVIVGLDVGDRTLLPLGVRDLVDVTLLERDRLCV